jgi:predicted anti-sigma-YlaC factor YlaD
MGCERYREALSAYLDGEDEPHERAAVEAHLAGCDACRGWLDAAAGVTRLARIGLAAQTPDVTAAVLAAAPAPGRRPRLVPALRSLLAGFGLVQLWLGMVQIAQAAAGSVHLHGGQVAGGATPDHLWHESAAWNVAVGAGFLWIALRRARPAGMVPTLSAFVVALTLLSTSDVFAGDVEPPRLLGHAVLLAGYLVVLALSRPDLDLRAPWRRPGGGTGALTAGR